MRLSTDKKDPSYKRDTTWATVYLDGKKQEGVVTADEEQGYIIKWEQNEMGQYMIENEDLIQVKYLGNVVIVGRPGTRTDKLYAK